jgi:hypothetical protein
MGINMKQILNKNQIIIASFFLLIMVVPLAIVQNAFAQAIDPAVLSVTVFLHGIGASGDSISSDSRLSNKDPDAFQKNIAISVYNTSNNLVLIKNDTILYNESKGAYTGEIEMDTLQSGTYIVKIKVNSHLQKRAGTTIRITRGLTVNIPSVILAAGDINGDNRIDVLDYNILRGCYSNVLPPTFCDDRRLLLSDISGDDNVDELDYNLFLREIGQVGD